MMNDTMKKYVIGLIKYLFYRNVSVFAKVTASSKISKNANINRYSKIFNSTIDKYSYVGSKSELVNAIVGKYCSIAEGCNIGLANHTQQFISTSPIFTEKKNGTGHSWVDKDLLKLENQKVTIGNDVWIGNKATVLSGINIGNGVIIGAGSIVTRDVPDFAVVAGVPARIIKYRFPNDIITKLLEIRWWDLPDNVLINNIKIFQHDNFTIEELKVFAFYKKTNE